MANEIVLYQPNEQMSLEVKLENETVWLTQQQIADLFGVKRPAVTKHLGNIFREGELDITSVSSILEHTILPLMEKYIVHNFITWMLYCPLVIELIVKMQPYSAVGQIKF